MRGPVPSTQMTLGKASSIADRSGAFRPRVCTLEGLAPRDFRRLRGTRPNLQHAENPVPVLDVNKLPQAKAAGD